MLGIGLEIALRPISLIFERSGRGAAKVRYRTAWCRLTRFFRVRQPRDERAAGLIDHTSAAEQNACISDLNSAVFRSPGKAQPSNLPVRRP